MFENSKDLTFADTIVTIHSALNDESREQIKNLAKEMV